MLVDLVAAGGAAGVILNHGSGGTPLLLMVLKRRWRGQLDTVRGGALGDRFKCLCRGDGRYTGSRTCQCEDVAPASRPCASRWSVNFACSVRNWGDRGGHGQIRQRSGNDSARTLASPRMVSGELKGFNRERRACTVSRASTAPPACSASALLAGASWLLGLNEDLPRAFRCGLLVLRLQ